MKRILVILAALACASCAEDFAEVVVVINSDYEAPTEVDRLVLTVEDPFELLDGNGIVRMAEAELSAGAAFPQALTIRNNAVFTVNSAYLGDFRVRAELYSGTTRVAESYVQFEFTLDEQRMVTIDIPRACADVNCRCDLDGADAICSVCSVSSTGRATCESIQQTTAAFVNPGAPSRAIGVGLDFEP